MTDIERLMPTDSMARGNPKHIPNSCFDSLNLKLPCVGNFVCFIIEKLHISY